MGHLLAASDVFSFFGSDFFGRLARFVVLFGPVATFVAVIVILAMAWQAVKGRRLVLFGILVLSYPFSSAISYSVDTATVMVRWYAIILLAMSYVAIRRFPGKAWLAYLGFVLMGIVFFLLSFAMDEIAGRQIQHSILILAVALAMGALAGHIDDRAQVTKICALFVVAAIIWAGLTVIFLPSVMTHGVITGAHRFTGASGRSGVIAMTGAILLPFALWGILFPWARKWQILCGILVVVMVVCLVATTQRGSIYSGAIACVPLLARRSLRKLIMIFLLAGGIAATGFYLASYGHEHMKFVAKRLSTLDTSGRADVWMAAWEQIRLTPLYGHGHGSHGKFENETLGLGMHNAYLVIWYNTGLVGLVLLFTAFTITALRAFRLILHPPDPATREFARLFLGLLMGVSAIGLVESSFASPSNIATVALLLSIVMPARLAALAKEQTTWWSLQPVRLVIRPTS